MVTVKSLENQMDIIIRTGLREAMQYADVMDRRDPLHEVKVFLYQCLYDPVHDQILKTHTEGYGAGGDLMRRAGIKVDWSPLGDAISYEDPRIAKMAKAVILGLEESLDGQNDAILKVILAEYEQGSSIPTISRGLVSYFDDNRAVADRMARTVTNDVYNRAHIERYEDSGVVDGMQYSAHLDDRTSEICEMLNGTIWAMGDPDIQVPPLHFNCRSRLVPYFGKIPGARDFTKEFGSEFVAGATETATTFRGKYWRTMAAAADSVERDALRQDLATVRDLIVDRCPVKPHHEPTVDEAYAKVGV